MIRTLAILTLITAVAGPAAAQDIRVQLAGKDARTISAEIDKAASTVCREAYRNSEIEFFEISSCAKGASDDAKAQAARILAVAHANEMSALAENSASLPRR